MVVVTGKKLTAYVAGVKDVRALDRWIDGAAPYMGLNPELNDRVPIRLLREGELEVVVPDLCKAAGGGARHRRR